MKTKGDLNKVQDVPRAINYTRYNTKTLTNIVKSVMRYTEIKGNYYVLFKKCKNLKSIRGEGSADRAVIWLPGPKSHALFPFDLNTWGLAFKESKPRVLASFIEAVAFVVAHEAKHAKGVKDEATCNEWAWGYLQMFREKMNTIIKKPLVRDEKFVVELRGVVEGERGIRRFSVGK